MNALDVVDGSSRAATVLNPMRMHILDALRDPGSASTVARQLGLARQKVNYHLRELEKAGFLEEVEKRRTGNCIERIVRAKATYYLIQPQLLGHLAADPSAIEDRFSATYLVALAAEAIRDVATAQQRAGESGKKLATFSLQTDVRFATAAARAEFTGELANAVASLVSRYHDENAAGGRPYRFLIGGYPRKKEKAR
jgi:DNA-binding transcriptional ArsR family regulator